jgi:hypothetical protein
MGNYKPAPNDDVEKVLSTNPDVNQLEYQVEVPLMAQNGPPLSHITFFKAVVHGQMKSDWSERPERPILRRSANFRRASSFRPYPPIALP